MPIARDIPRLTGITNATLRAAPPFAEWAAEHTAQAAAAMARGDERRFDADLYRIARLALQIVTSA